MLTFAEGQLLVGAHAQVFSIPAPTFLLEESGEGQRVHGTRQHSDETTGRGEEEASLKLHLEINCMRPADSSLISVMPHMAEGKYAGLMEASSAAVVEFCHSSRFSRTQEMRKA